MYNSTLKFTVITTMEKIKLRGERWPWRNEAWMRRIIYCPQVLRWFVWMLKGLDYDKMAGAVGGSSGSHWKGLCHVLEVSRVSFRSYIQIVTVMNSVISGTLVQVKSMKRSHSFPIRGIPSPGFIFRIHWWAL